MGVYKLTVWLKRVVPRPFCPGTEGRMAPGRTDCGEESCRGVSVPSPPGENRAGGDSPRTCSVESGQQDPGAHFSPRARRVGAGRS